MDENLDVVELGGSPVRRAFGLRRLAADPRTAVTLLVLGGATALASLSGEWQLVTSVARPEDSFINPDGLVNDVWSVPVGDTYLTSLVLLGALIAVGLAGPAQSRAVARTAGLGLSAAMLVLVGFAAYRMNAPSGVPQFGNLGLVADQSFKVSLARGMWAALATPLLLGLSFLSAYLRGAVERAEAAPLPAVEEIEPQEIELTVSTAAPFVRQY